MNPHAYLTDITREMDALPCSHPASVNLDVANWYHALTMMLRPRLVVEIGCFIGFSTQHFAEALRQLGFGRILSIDAFDWDVDTGTGAKENRQIVAERYLRKSGLEDTVRFIKGYSTEVFPLIREEIADSVDLLYIDGDHTVGGVFADFNTYYGSVRCGGHILLHDIYPAMCGCDGPRVLIDTLRRGGHLERDLDLCEMTTRDGYGVALLRKRTTRPIRVDVNPARNAFRRMARKLLGRADVLTGSPASVPLAVTVIDDRTGKAVPGATLLCAQRLEPAYTADADGRILIGHYIPNRYLVDVRAPGYAEQSAVLLDLAAGRPLNVEIRLQPLPGA